MTNFESTRGGSPHRYEIHETELVYHTGVNDSQKTLSFRWRDLEKIISDNGGILYFVPRRLDARRQKLAIWLEGKSMENFLDAALGAWGKQDRGAAAKAAFDYGADQKVMAWVWITMSICFPGLLSILLLTDGYHTMKCNRLLEHNRKSAPANLAKITKDRRGNFVWKLEFQAEGTQQLITGKRTAFVFDKTGHPTSPLEVIYSPDDLSCWDIKIERTGELNSANRHFNVLMDMSFGWVFAILAAITSAVGIFKLRRKMPFKAEVKKAGDQLMTRQAGSLPRI